MDNIKEMATSFIKEFHPFVNGSIISWKDRTSFGVFDIYNWKDYVSGVANPYAANINSAEGVSQITPHSFILMMQNWWNSDGSESVNSFVALS